MTHIFGDKSDFAIEARVEPDLIPGDGVWGHMCVWCRGAALGDIDNHYCGLGPAYISLRWLTANLEELWAPELEGLDDVAVYNLIDNRLYGEIEGRDVRKLVVSGVITAPIWCKFDFCTDWGEQFDGTKAFIVCPPGAPVRFLCQQFPTSTGHRVDVSRSAFVDASNGFVRWYQEQELRLRRET